MNFRFLRIIVGTALIGLLLSTGCGGGGSSSSNPAVTSASPITPASPGPAPSGTPVPPGTPAAPGTPAPATGSVHVLVSDDATEDWATIGVKVLGISLVPQGGGATVVVFTAPSPAPIINLVQLDQLGEIIGNATVPDGTYTAANLTLSANPGDVTLISSAEPAADFDGPAGTAVSPDNIQIQRASGSAGRLTVTLTIQLVQPLTVTANSTNVLDLEFDLKHPAFIVEHWPASSAAPLWAVNFGRSDLNGPMRHHPVHDLTRLILRQTLGQVTALSPDKSAITITKDYVTYPVPASGQVVPIASTVILNVLADAANGTIFCDVDNQTKATIKSFSTIASSLLKKGVGKYVRIAARYQADGSLVAVRIWASAQFPGVWLSPEGHVVHVDRTNQVMTVGDENGNPVAINIGANTLFYFRTPQNAAADAISIGTGKLFFDAFTPGSLPYLARGFKVHASLDPLASSPTAESVDIDIARYDGVISSSNTGGSVIYTRLFQTKKDQYTGSLDFLANSTANGADFNGNAVTGFDWWYFTLPTLAECGAHAIPDLMAAIRYDAIVGGNVSPFNRDPWGVSYLNWGNGGTANVTSWYANDAIIEPAHLPKGTVSSPFTGGIFGMTVTGGTLPVNVALSTVSGSASLVYEVNNVNGIVTVTQRDLTNSTDFSTVQQALVNGTQVKAFGVPTAGGNVVAAYVMFYYTGTLPR